MGAEDVRGFDNATRSFKNRRRCGRRIVDAGLLARGIAPTAAAHHLSERLDLGRPECGLHRCEGKDRTPTKASTSHSIRARGSGNTAQIVASKAARFRVCRRLRGRQHCVQGRPVEDGRIFRRNPAAEYWSPKIQSRRPKDLADKTIGIATGSAQFQQFPAFLKGSNLDPAKVRVVNVDSAGAGPALINGQVAAIAGFAQAPTQASHP